MTYNIYTIKVPFGNGFENKRLITEMSEDELMNVLNFEVDIVGCKEYVGKINDGKRR